MEVITNSSVFTLRQFKLSDADDFMMYGGDDKVTRLTRRDIMKTKEEALAFIEKDCIPHPYCRSICINDRSIGYLYIKQGMGDGRCRAEVGFMLAAKYWGQGIVTKAVKIAIVEGFKEFPDILRMQAHTEVVNKGSQRVLEKVGFVKEALFRKYTFNKDGVKDLYMYSLLSTDPIL